MSHTVQGYTLRKPVPADVDALYAQKNDPEVASLLGGLPQYAQADIKQWVEFHRVQKDESLWIIADGGGRAVGHVGLYKIDPRVRSAEFAIVIGEKKLWGTGLGRACTEWMVRYGFEQLNLQRIELQVQDRNERARRLYQRLGFKDEGVRRRAQYKDGRYVDMVLMGLLDDEWTSAAGRDAP